jgi:uncharacterized protein YbjQ (UPF0145 family)
MAFDVNAFVQNKTSKNKTGFDVNKFLASKGLAKQDLGSSGGLYQTALGTGNSALITEANSIMNPEQTLWGRFKSGSKKLLGKTLDVLQRGNYAVASAVKNQIDDDASTTILGGLKSGITGRTKHTFDDVFTEAGWNPESRAGKIAKGTTAFAADVLLDPTTYLTFGYGAGAKVSGKVLSKAGMKFAAKASTKKIGTEFGEKFLKESIVRMAQNSPELYGKFLDKGGVKFFGETIISGGRIAAVLQAIPGVSKLDDVTKSTRNSLYALVNRDASAKFGKLPQEYIELQQKYRDLGAIKSSDAMEEAMQIAQANKITQPEARIITNAIENGTHLADERLENARRLYAHIFGRNLRDEQLRGISIGKLPNYVPHILVDNKKPLMNFKPEGARVSLGASKSRDIVKYTSLDTGEEIISSSKGLNFKEHITDIERNKIEGAANEFMQRRDIKIQDLQQEAEELADAVNDVFTNKAGTKFEKEVLGNMDSVSRNNFKNYMQVFKSRIQKFTPEEIRLMEAQTNKVVGDLSKISPEAADALRAKISKEFGETSDEVKNINELLNKANNAPGKVIKDGVEKSVDKTDLIQLQKEVNALARVATQNSLDEGALTAFTARIAKEFFDDPAGARGFIKRILKKDSKIAEFTDEISGRIAKASEELAALPDAAKYFSDSTGKKFTKAQASIQEINDAFGKEFFEQDIVKAAAIRSTASARATTSADFLRETARKFGAAADKAPSNYVKASAKELEGMLFHPAIAEHIDTFQKGLIGDEATNNLLRAYDGIQNLWKASVTSIFPAFHGRNAISNVFLNFLDIGAGALNPAQHKLSLELLNLNRQATSLKKASLGVGPKAVKAKADLQTLLKKQVTNDGARSWTFGELRKEIKNNRVAFGNDYTGFLDIQDTVDRKLSRVKSATSKARSAGMAVNPLSQENLVFRAGRATGRVVEEQARLVNFLTNLQKTGDVTLSAQRTKQFLFDYENLSKFEKTFMRRIIPFYTFTRKNLELQATQLIKQPGKFATQAKLFTQLSKSISGGTLTDEEKKSLPDWLQSGLGLVVGRDGQDVDIINSLGTPVEALFSSLQPNAILGSLSPIAAVPLQVAIGKHFFFDRDLKDVDNAAPFKNAPQFIKDYIGYSERKNKDGSVRAISLNPTRMFIIQNIPPSSRVVSVIGQLEDENVSGKLKLLRQTTGLKPYGKNLDEEAAYREKEKVRALQDLLDKSGVAPIFRKSFIPKEK